MRGRPRIRPWLRTPRRRGPRPERGRGRLLPLVIGVGLALAVIFLIDAALRPTLTALARASAVRVGRRAASIRKITARASPTPITRGSSRPLPRSGLGPRRRGVRSQGRILGLPRMASPPG